MLLHTLTARRAVGRAACRTCPIAVARRSPKESRPSCNANAPSTLADCSAPSKCIAPWTSMQGAFLLRRRFEESVQSRPNWQQHLHWFGQHSLQRTTAVACSGIWCKGRRLLLGRISRLEGSSMLPRLHHSMGDRRFATVRAHPNDVSAPSGATSRLRTSNHLGPQSREMSSHIRAQLCL